MNLEITSTKLLELGNLTMDAALGNPSFGAIFRQPLPPSPATLTVPHWLFAAKGDVPLPDVVLDFQASSASGRLVIPDSANGGSTSKVWKVYPAASSLLYASPYAPVVGGGEILITEDDWEVINGRTVITRQEITDGRWKIAYSHGGGEVSARKGDGYEAYPVWAPLARGEAHCAPDTLRWFESAAVRAMQLDDRQGKAAQWQSLRDAVRRSSVRGRNITDGRDVFDPLVGVPVFDLDGMFARSDHPSAMPPPAGMDQSWLGYGFWSRASNGDILGTIPGSSPAKSVQIGRDVTDSWRVAAAYQDPDQYLYLEIAVRKDADAQLPTGAAKAFVSSSRQGTASSRWEAVIDFGSGQIVQSIDGYEIRAYLIPRSALLREDNASALPAGTAIASMGISFAFQERYLVRIRKMRQVSGPSAQWVQDNIAKAKRSAPLPYFPAAAPYSIGADTVNGNLIGYTGSPFHGNQMPDSWLDLDAECNAVHAGLTAADLPTVNASGQLTYPINSNTVGGYSKSISMLLAEQQVRFLLDAQARYLADSGVEGPFAHTFVLNTDARLSIGSPTPHTWVYRGDDADTAWVGHQVRPMESLARLVHRAVSRSNAEDVMTMALSITTKWLTWLATAWPNLQGSPWKGPPTSFPEGSTPAAGYEDPHAAAVVLRAILYLRLAGKSTPTLDALAVQCWTYLEMHWVTEGRMAGTWSPVPDQRQWYGFWHGEIMETMGLIVMDAKAVLPAGVSRDIALDRLVKSYNWLSEWGVRGGS